jgi:uncharacterized protein with FMN-binding domain
MRRITVAVMSTISALVVLFSYHTSTNSPSASAAEPSTDPQPVAQPSTEPSTEPSTGSSGASKTYTGDAVDTRWGPVQVEITVAGGRISSAQAVVYPTNNPRDEEINAYAVPELNSEAVQQQSGDIDAVSGATVTSDGYRASLQSAIDQANL